MQGVLMGNLTELVVRKPNGREITIKPRGRRIGWVPSRRDLIIVKAKPGGVARNPPGSIAGIHKKFHNVAPQKFRHYEWPDPVGGKNPVGLIVSLTYTIPDDLKSPEKKQYRWCHEFGDHGERGHGTMRSRGNYPERLMPLLLKDHAGNLYIKRRKGNKYYVSDWLYW